MLFGACKLDAYITSDREGQLFLAPTMIWTLGWQKSIHSLSDRATNIKPGGICKRIISCMSWGSNLWHGTFVAIEWWVALLLVPSQFELESRLLVQYALKGYTQYNLLGGVLTPNANAKNILDARFCLLQIIHRVWTQNIVWDEQGVQRIKWCNYSESESRIIMQ